jgi:chromosome segregation ATPase
MTILSPDVRAVVRALDALTTQVRRIADQRSTPVVAPSGYQPTGVRPEPTTSPDTPSPLADDAPAPNLLHVLVDRAARGVLTEGEAATFRRRVEQLRAGRETWKGKAEEIERDRDRIATQLEKLRAVLEYEHKRANDAIDREESAEQAAEEQRRRADIAETELRVLRAGLRANGADPTQIQNLWAQIRLRNRQWRDTKRDLADAQAVIERVREVARWLRRNYPALTHVRGRLADALDGTEQPTTEALHAKLDEATATLRRVRAVTKDWEQRTLPHSEAHRLLTDVREGLAGPRPDPQPTPED